LSRENGATNLEQMSENKSGMCAEQVLERWQNPELQMESEL
jgi:hypothetical protein